MLKELSIKNIAVIKDISVQFDSGMNVLTGETGAGKSIIIDSINMVLGQRTNKEIVRFNEKKSLIQAVFSVNDQVKNHCAEKGFECDDDLIITREIYSDGKSTARINGVIVNLNALHELGEMLINIHGQQDNQSLLTPMKHIDFIDEFAGNDALLNDFKEKYTAHRSLEKQLSEINVDEDERLKQIDLLSFQIDEIDKACLVIGEEEELEEQRDIIVNSEKIAKGVNGAISALYDNDSESSAYDLISVAISELDSIGDYSDLIKEALSSLYDAQSIVEDYSHSLREFENEIDFDEQVLNDTMERLDLIKNLKRKYRKSIEEILNYRDQMSSELSRLENSKAITLELTDKIDKAYNKLISSAKALSKSRADAAHLVEKQITDTLAELNMEHSEFFVNISKNPDLITPKGIDKIEFLIKTSSKEVPKPLAKIASGGELSRVMLALKSILSDNVDTLIFDEIDTGVSGNAAQKIANKLWEISTDKQVLCISHLPQLASMSDHHFLIEKNFVDDEAITTVCELDPAGRINEVARITGGELTELSINHAKELIAHSKEFKEK